MSLTSSSCCCDLLLIHSFHQQKMLDDLIDLSNSYAAENREMRKRGQGEIIKSSSKLDIQSAFRYILYGIRDQSAPGIENRCRRPFISRAFPLPINIRGASPAAYIPDRGWTCCISICVSLRIQLSTRAELSSNVGILNPRPSSFHQTQH